MTFTAKERCLKLPMRKTRRIMLKRNPKVMSINLKSKIRDVRRLAEENYELKPELFNESRFFSNTELFKISIVRAMEDVDKLLDELIKYISEEGYDGRT